MVVRRVSLLLSGRDLESLLEGLDGEEACLSRIQGACVAGVELSRVFARRAELLRLQGVLVEAYAAGVDPEASEGESRPGPRESASAAVSAVFPASERHAWAAVDPARVLSAVEVAVPVGVWEGVLRWVWGAEELLTIAAKGRLPNAAFAGVWVDELVRMRAKWQLQPRDSAEGDRELELIRESCPGCGMWFERPLTLASGSVCPVCAQERARGDQA